MSPSDMPLKANPAERSLPSGADLSPAGPRRFIVVFGVAVVYALMLSLLFFDKQTEPVVAAEAIPVEIVVEPPPPPPEPQEKPQPPAPKAEPPPQSLNEEPATDAPDRKSVV